MASPRHPGALSAGIHHNRSAATGVDRAKGIAGDDAGDSTRRSSVTSLDTRAPSPVGAVRDALVAYGGGVIETPDRQRLAALARALPVALVPLLLAASTFPGQYRVPGVYWLLALAASVVFVLGARWPVTACLAISALAIPMFRIPAWGLSGLVPFLGAVALVDVIRRSHRNSTVLLTTAGWTAAVVLGRMGYHDQTVSRATPVLEVCAYVGVAVLLGLYLRGQRELAVSLRLRAADAEQRRAEAEQRTRLVERGALARELHDLVAHHMASIVLRIGITRHVVADADPRVHAVLDDVHGTASDALADIRRLLTALRDPALGEVALVDSAAVRTEIDAAAERVRAAGFAVETEIRTRVDGLDAIGRLTLLRLVQESFTNVMKHAEPAVPVRLTITVADADDPLGARRDTAADKRADATADGYAGSFDIAPDGRTGIVVRVRSGLRVSRHGETSATGANSLGAHGIVGMRERVELAGGRVVAGADGADWEVVAWLPETNGENA
ncbi:histidine kinase [Nocardia sp. NBC_01503]|uniref:sensor histidine kinase n=1 Tax=Nocardia sp. NBC_01503 TaxID=2975997 RepID=UPI002E7B74B7|nr:histidine kinase [Nocardia sp. NBC_01503]WTL33023.1 histidine kinase [Nocardia sp. NBC_01503]